MRQLISKSLLILSLVALSTITAEAQIGSLLNRAKRRAQQRVENKVEEKVDKAVTQAVDKVFDGKETQTKGVTELSSTAQSSESQKTAYGIALRDDEYDCGDNRICLRTEDPLYYKAYMTPDWSFIEESAWTPEINGEPQPLSNSEAVEKNALYYLARLEQATKAKNLEDMLGIYYERALWLYNEMATRASRMSFFHNMDYDKYKERFGEVITEWKTIVWEGNPEIKLGQKEKATQFDQWRDERYNSYIFLAKRAAETQGAAREFYLRFTMEFREMLVGTGDFKPSDPKYSELEQAILAVLPQTSEEFQKEKPYRSPEQIIAEKKARDDQRAQERAEQQKAAAAARAANTKAWPKSNMGNAALQASCLKAIKAQYPDLDAKRVSIINSSWQIDRDGLGNILRRRVSAWVDCKGEDGSRVAQCFGFAEDYMGGGKYGSIKFFGTGTNRPFYIK
ncbi:hypothetical protein [uncultured Porphyromonas sp.]|uniref:hypothetical protein n=1 Tax=uncultured Porphyromonas sp. TaxID=159274 RepID=UPI00262DFF5C|nr:hypothetical protein [uncultured Porphyromonas sp.]